MAEEKEEIIENETPIQTMEELAELQRSEADAIAKKYDEIFEKLESGGYFKQGYSDDSVVQLPGQLFGEFVNFVNAQMTTLYTIGNSIQILHNTNEALITNLSHMTIKLMKQHMTNVDTGSTSSLEDIDAQDAEKEVKVVKETPRKNKGKKAVGTS